MAGPAISIVISPASALSMQPIRLSSVVLPEPDSPAMLMNSPWPISRETPRSARTLASPLV
jgi:hypothetical protein